MGKLILLMGKTGVGKSTIEKELGKLGCKRVISYTTRPKRSNEQDGVDYHFVNEDVFSNYNYNKELLATCSYSMNGIGEVLYGIHKDSIDLSGNDLYVAVVEKVGFEQLLETIGRENIISILLTANPYIRVHRYLARDEHASMTEFNRRHKLDEIMFKDLDNQVDMIVKNNNDMTPKEVAKLILTYI